MQNRDRECLLRIIEHCQRILDAQKRFGDSLEKFCSDADYRDVINMNIFQIGELSNQLSDSIKDKINDIPWHEIHGIRNVMAHAYIIVDNSTILSAVDLLVQVIWALFELYSANLLNISVVDVDVFITKLSPVLILFTL